MKRFLCLLMTLIMVLGLFPTAALAAGNEGETQTLPESISTDTVWFYLDDGTDPAGNPEEDGYNRTSWTAADFDDSEWETAYGSFGAKNGETYTGATVQKAAPAPPTTSPPTISERKSMWLMLLP